jgi:hypothetical protein
MLSIVSDKSLESYEKYSHEKKKRNLKISAIVLIFVTLK